jgi:hypothetical protein
MKGHDIGSVLLSDNDAIRKLIDAQAKVRSLQDENKALRNDRNDLLREHEDYTNRRKVASLPKPKPRSGGDYIRMSFGDMHGCLMDKPAVAALLQDIKTIGPDEIVLGGDMLECGGFLARHQPIGFVATSEYSYQDDVEACNWFLDELAKVAPKAQIIYLEGNHEDRVERWIVDVVRAHGREADFLLRLNSPQTLLKIEERGIVYVRRMQVEGGLPPGWVKRGKMYFVHELASGGSGAAKAASKTAGNVTFFHTHQESAATQVFPSVGIVKAFCPGCLCERQPLWRHSNPTNWSHGYGIDIIAASENFQHISVPIWEGESLGTALVGRK